MFCSVYVDAHWRCARLCCSMFWAVYQGRVQISRPICGGHGSWGGAFAHPHGLHPQAHCNSQQQTSSVAGTPTTSACLRDDSTLEI